MPRRIAALSLPELPLQILLRDRPSWRSAAVAVVDSDRPDAKLVHLNEVAKRHRLRTGMRQGAARGVLASLRTAVVPESRVAEVMEDLVNGLQAFSPRVEADRAGLLFIDPGGLARLYGGLRTWATAVHEYLRGRGLRGGVVVGFARHRAWAIAQSRVGPLILATAAEEQRLSGAVPLAELDVAPDLRDGLAALGVETVDALLALPPGELGRRFGPEASALSARFLDDPQLPMQPAALPDPVRVELEIDPPDADHARLLFALKGALHELVREVTARRTALGAIRIALELDRAPVHHERLEPASPTRDALALLELVRLRLAEVTLAGPVARIAIEAEPLAADPTQLRLAEGAGRDPRAAARALSRLRAAYGPAAVTRARLRDAHLPEARFEYEPIVEVEPGPAPAPATAPPLVRRVLARPRVVPPRDEAHPEAGPEAPPGHPPILRLYGPYRISGGWWARPVERDYYYAETGSGSLLWLYFDRPRRRWLLQGVVD
jgi:protein ImuB